MEIVPYGIDDGKIKWAEKRVKAMRGALLELPAAVTGMKKASAALRKASKCCKAYSESSAMASLADSLDRTLADFEELSAGWDNDTNAIQMGIVNYRMGGTKDDVDQGSDRDV